MAVEVGQWCYKRHRRQRLALLQAAADVATSGGRACYKCLRRLLQVVMRAAACDATTGNTNCYEPRGAVLQRDDDDATMVDGGAAMGAR